MKTLLKTCATAALIVISICTMADGRPEKRTINLSMAKLALDHYLEVITEGESIGLEQLFAPEFCQRIQTEKSKSHSRSEIINFLKKQRGEKLNCITSYQVLEQCPNSMIAKVTLKFENFTMTDLVTLINEDGAWKVLTSVHTYQ
ncbi:MULTISPECIES: nuclear transport factor 2 family protein [Sphingobacterium]|jgi:hypothetical protein|uniref:nuclear transport factor 2 family protein n=1 Tax=Sphingobacterium TaxID=28453 RepID=UPI0004E5EEEC|nr:MULTISPECIES: nuclear transport factor 2 family protein [Sphingobacterium]CDS96801.1 conserved exported hypothetical protein [Sphingobacterium sp. PM2-P1-29]PTX10334.1 putative lumazine-binding protein [Sphingobacterium faecium]UPZ35642.1 nuclear transport factor 2 family protein [Sphingobacterium sp. PCS056]UXD71220.1 nuclear transport factor 2 family protein [Sphingobacterium faecium]WGQ14865.1 nuclear transport factor 2 family protein [Sphingobacterium faecium]